MKDVLDDLSSNCSITIDKVEQHKDYVCHIFRGTFSVPKPTIKYFIEVTKDDWDTETEVSAG